MARIVGRWAWWLLAGLPLLVFLALPVVAIAIHAIGVRGVVSDEFLEPVRLSFETSAMSIAAIVLLGTPLAFAIARFKFPLRWLLNSMIDLPVVLPPAAAGIGLLLAYGHEGYLRKWFGVSSLAFTVDAVVMAQTFVASPFYLRAAINAFSRIDWTLNEAAAVDGADPSQILRTIVIPQCGPALTSGAITSWARAIGEFGATILFAGSLMGKTETMPLAIYLGFEDSLDQSIALSGVLLGTAFVAIVVARFMSARIGGEET